MVSEDLRQRLIETLSKLGGGAGNGRLGEALIAPLFQRCVANSLESRTLAATRDLLLPRLMSGELRVKDAETIAAEAA